MPDIVAEGIEISIENEMWRLYNQTGTNSLTPFFTAMRGDGLVRYTAAFGEARGLPGDVLSVDLIQAVVVGYDERRTRWVLGLHVVSSKDPKPRFAELVHWPQGDTPQVAADSHTAGRVLAEYLRCPLKVFGARKPPAKTGPLNPRMTTTGPLVPHQREDLSLDEVRFQASKLELPLDHNNIWLGMAGNLTLRLPREAAQKSQGEAPAFQQVIFDKNGQQVRLVPPTGLLGMFLGSGGRNVPFTGVRNVEVRHVTSHESHLEKDADGMSVDMTTTVHSFFVYLTLREESLLILKVDHATSSELQRRRLKMNTAARTDLDTSVQDMVYMKEHQRDQRLFERVQHFAEQAGIAIANSMDRPLVKTSVGELG